jgi:hypothetical protein
MNSHRSVWTALGVVAILAAPAAAGDRIRTVKADYLTAGGVDGVMSGDTVVQGSQYGAATIPTRRGEYAVDLTITDKAGTAVAAEAAQDVDGDGTADTTLATFCGRTSGPVRIKRAGAPVIVYVLAGPCGSAASAPTAGTVTARLHTR